MSNEPVGPLQHGVLFVSGYGVQLRVERGHLVVQDGVANRRRSVRFSRVDQDLKRVVVLGHSGMITLDTIDWLHGVGVPLVHLSHDGRVYFVSTPQAKPPAQLRRAQALAAGTPKGDELARALILAKIDGQLHVLKEVPGSDAAQEAIQGLRAGAKRARTLHETRDHEARAARAYWRAWRRVRLQFLRADAARRPKHWGSFGSRISLLTDPSPRKATNPANAVLNYLYAMLEAETVIAIHGARLDPMLGVLHQDRMDRPSLAADLMEPVRPRVDAFALSMFRDHKFAKEELVELKDGHCRITPLLTRRLAATASLWAQASTPLADQLAKALVKPGRPKNLVPGVPIPTNGSKKRPRGRTALSRLFDPGRATTWTDLQRSAGAVKGPRRYAHTITANREWNRSNAPRDPDEFTVDILPCIQRVPLRDLSRTTGMSMAMCSEIRRGLRLPHPRHWEKLAAAGLEK